MNITKESEDVRLDNVCICSDSLEMVRAVFHPAMESDPLGVLVIEVKSLFLANGFVSIKHMHRSVNGVAHFLVYRVFNLSSNLVWLDGNISHWYLVL